MDTPSVTTIRRFSEWWDRNWKWFLTVVVLGSAAVFFTFLGGILLLAFGTVKRTDVYKMSLAIAQESPMLIAEIGEPVEPGWFPTGNFHYSGGSGDADLSIPLHGPRGEAVLYVLAVRHLGEWQVTDVVARIEESGKRLDILETGQ